MIHLCWSLIRASFLKSGATRQIFTRQLGSNNLDRDRLTMCLVSFYIEKFLYDLDEYIQHTCTTYYIQSDTSSSKLLQQNSIMCRSAVFSTQLNQLTSVNTELQTKSNNQVLCRALLMKQNLIFGLVWAGWRVQSSGMFCTFHKSFKYVVYQ